MNHGEQNMREQEYQQLKQNLDALIARVQQLHKDNVTLRQERDSLKLRNHEAKARVEAILQRLKTLEAQS
ncbi:MAG: hypothetical protein U0998_04855 [Moraxellaceae bacterium]|nr:hypothetical protein [Moraxellaceae bacterium]MDP1775840.1 hypothetical protein [Moraxellaceae bacterium]MDZ4297029.1 hypothetical protein [Moraxellaceae bacterium]MDZ4386537.1 hypothetical protein [Moraxellaceae bacterium]